MDSSSAHDTIVVTGATGFVGRHLVDRLVRDTQVVGWYRPGDSAPEHSDAVAWIPVDLTDKDSVSRAIDLHPPSHVYHLGGAANIASSWHNTVANLRVNALGTHYLFEAVRQTDKVCRLLVISSAAIYQASEEALREDAPVGPTSPYGLSKLAEDELAMRAAADEGLDVVVARPFNHIGPGQSPAYAVSNFARQVARIEAGLDIPSLRVGNLDARRDVTDVRDIVEAYVSLMGAGRSGVPYNICSGRAWRMRDLLDELIHLAQVQVEVEVDPALLRPADVPSVHGDSSRIRSELGWTPAFRVEQTLQDTLTWWRERTRLGH